MLGLTVVVLSALAISWPVRAYQNYSSMDMLRAQLALEDDRPDDCPPWSDFLPIIIALQLTECAI